MKSKKLLSLGVGLAGIFALASAANASYVTYDFTGGSITVSATLSVGGGPAQTILSAGTIALTGGDVVFDPTASTMQLLSFAFSGATLAPMTLSGLFAGDTLSISGLSVSPGVGYGVTGFGGSNPYIFQAHSIAATGNFSLTGTAPPAPLSGMFSEAGGDNSILAATVTLGGTGPGRWQVLGLKGIDLGSYTVGTGSRAETLILKGDITFNAATPVPLPAALCLLVSGLGLFPFARRMKAA
jgi:hypothetical protein